MCLLPVVSAACPAAGPGRPVGVPVSRGNGRRCTDAADGRAQRQRNNRHAHYSHHAILRCAWLLGNRLAVGWVSRGGGGGDGAWSVSAGTNTPPAIAATPVPAIPAPIGVNGYSSVPAPTNGQQATEALYTNGVHPYQGTSSANASTPTERTIRLCIALMCIYLFNSLSHPAQSPAALDPLQQAYAGMQHYTGWFTPSSSFCVTISSEYCPFLVLFSLIRDDPSECSRVKAYPPARKERGQKDGTYISMQQHDIILHYHMTEHLGKQRRQAVKQGHLKLMKESHCSGDQLMNSSN